MLNIWYGDHLNTDEKMECKCSCASWSLNWLMPDPLTRYDVSAVEPWALMVKIFLIYRLLPFQAVSFCVFTKVANLMKVITILEGKHYHHLI
jgi:hypothetical protein